MKRTLLLLPIILCGCAHPCRPDITYKLAPDGTLRPYPSMSGCAVRRSPGMLCVPQKEGIR